MPIKIERHVFTNAVGVFVLTYLVTQMLHELAHALTGAVLGASPILFHNHVDYVLKVSTAKQTWIAAAGPLYSLFQTVVCFFISRRKAKSAVINLFWTWMLLWGYIGFFGYVFMTPFFKYGDTGFVAEQMNIPEVARLVVGGLGIGAFFFLPAIGFKNFAYLWRRDDKKIFYDSLILFPMIVGVAINTLLNLPVPTFLSLLAPMCMPWSVMMVYGQLMSRQDLIPDPANGSDHLHRFSKLLWVFVTVAVILNQILVFGIHL